MFPFIQCQCFDKRRGVYLVEKVSVFIKIRVLFWPEISALGVFLNLITSVCAPLNTQVPPGARPAHAREIYQYNSQWIMAAISWTKSSICYVCFNFNIKARG